jgi:nucleoside-diphosphate-sugar epimerase
MRRRPTAAKHEAGNIQAGNMKLAVTGITSGVGRRLAEVCAERGDELRGLVRDPKRDDAQTLQRAGVALVAGDLLDETALAELCDGVDAVIHMAAYVGDWGDRGQFERINVDGTRAVVEVAGRANVKRFVQLSSTAVYGRPERGRITEKWPTRICGPAYDDTKTAAERLAFGRGRELGLEVSAVRPPVIYGPYDRNFIPRTLRMLDKGMMILIDGGHAPLNVVWVDHVIDVLLRCAEMDEAIGEAFNVMDTVSDRPPSVREVTETIARSAGYPVPTRSVPYPVARALAVVAEKAWRWTRRKSPPPVTPFVVRITTLDVIYDSSKAVERLGWVPSMTPLEGVAKYAALLSDRS